MSNTLLLDTFSYENNNKKPLILVFYSLFFEKNIIFFINSSKKNLTKSFSNLFKNSTWLERETSEMSNITFQFKKDTRNLLLIYGDNTYPLLKAFPSIGFKEFFYNSANDKIVLTKVSIQF